MRHTEYLLVPILESFEWFDEGLQASLQSLGWPTLSRPESIVMTHVQLGIVRPADIARSMRLTRQAIHATIQSLTRLGVFEMAPDPDDRRIKIVTLTRMGLMMQRDALDIVSAQMDILGKRIGKARLKALQEAFKVDWGGPPTVALNRDRDEIAAIVAGCAPPA